MTTTPTATDLAAAFVGVFGTSTLPPGTTIGGVRLNYAISWGTVTGATARMSFGIIVASELTAASVDGPVENPHADWMGYHSHFGLTTNDEIEYAAGDRDRSLDIRSRRRLDEVGMRLYIVSETAEDTCTFRGVASTLLILP